jgi:hypothetical protein
MKFIIAIILIAVFSFVAGLYLPWWSIAIVSFFVILLIPMRNGKAFLSGFLGIFILWALLAVWIDIQNEGILSKKIMVLFNLNGPSILLIFITSVVGAVVGGLGALSSSYLRSKR